MIVDRRGYMQCPKCGTNLHPTEGRVPRHKIRRSTGFGRETTVGQPWCEGGGVELKVLVAEERKQRAESLRGEIAALELEIEKKRGVLRNLEEKMR